MLPSGNDAAIALAEGFGNRIFNLRKLREKKVVKNAEEEIKIIHENKENPVKIFVKEMNKHV